MAIDDALERLTNFDREREEQNAARQLRQQKVIGEEADTDQAGTSLRQQVFLAKNAKEKLGKTASVAAETTGKLYAKGKKARLIYWIAEAMLFILAVLIVIGLLALLISLVMSLLGIIFDWLIKVGENVNIAA